MQKRMIFIVWIVTWSLAGCVMDTIYTTDHPDQAQLTVSTDWSDRGTGIDKPSTWFIATADHIEEAQADRYTLSVLFDPATYPFFLFNDVPDIPVEEGIARVRTVVALSDKTEEYVEPLPGWLFTGMLVATLEKDTDSELPVSMHQQVRQLTFVVHPDGDAAGRIESIAATLSGVSSAWDIETDSPVGRGLNVAPEFIRRPDGSWAATVRLLGVTGDQQLLTGTIRLSDTSPAEVPLQSDLTESLLFFNSNKRTPFSLESSVTIDPEPETEAGFTATINGWKRMDGGSGIAH